MPMVSSQMAERESGENPEQCPLLYMPIIECAENKPLSGSVTDGKAHIQGKVRKPACVLKQCEYSSVTGLWQAKT